MTTSILIVEDESIVALDLQLQLNRLGYQVVGIADSGEEALQLAEIHQPDLTLMDIRLKGPADGIDTAQALRKRQDAPIVYLTAYADEATLQRAKQTEPYGYLVKPFEERELHSTVEMAIYKITNERQQKTHAARLQKIMATVPEGVVLLDADQRVVLANAKAQEFLLTLANVQIGDVVTHLGPYSIERLLHFSNDEGWHEFQSTGMPLRIFEVNITRVQTDDDSGDVSGEHVLVLRDVTLEREIRDRIQVQDRLAAVGQFAAGIAHDFNNILASIMLQPYIIQRQEGHLRPRSLECLENITQQAERGAELIKQLLDFSRSSALEMHPFDLVPLLKELTKMFERLLPANITLKLSVGPEDFKVKGDPTRTLQLLMNLASNARDAMPDGGELLIELSRTTGDDFATSSLGHGDWIQIRVRDTGSGIHPEILPHIFEPFFTTKAAGKGTGLGLAQVYGIVQQHGGQININSQLGQGTTFSIYFPALNDQPDGDLSASDEPGMLFTGHGELILLVEDNAAIGNSLSEVLQLSNYRVLTADNGHSALALIEQADTRVNLIISDLAMPDMGGVELCQEVRQRQLNIPVLILSGYVSEAALAELRALGVVDCLAKPVDVEILLDRVYDALRAHPPA